MGNLVQFIHEKLWLIIYPIISSSVIQVFDEWNKGELESFLIEISRDILRFKDTDGKYLLEKIRDTAGQVCNLHF